MATWKTLVILLAITATLDLVASQKRTKVGTSIAGSETKAAAVDFECPEEFGYYRHQTDCTRYYVCVFGGALEESCTGGLVYSHELQTCDWPRNVACITGQDQPPVQQVPSSSRPTDSSRNRKPVQSESQGVKSTSQLSNSNTNNGLNQLASSISNHRGKPSESVSLPLELLDEDFTLQGNLDPGRQGRDFRGPGRGPNPSSSVQDSSFRNNIVSEGRRTNTHQQQRVEEDFVPATTFNPTLVTSGGGRFQNRPPVVSSTPISNTAPVRSQSTSQFNIGTSEGVSNFDFDEWGAQFTNRNPTVQQEQRPQPPRPVESHGQFLVESTPTQVSSKTRPSHIPSDTASNSQPSRSQFERPTEQTTQNQRVVPSKPVQHQQQKQQFQSPSAVTDFQESTDSDDFALYDGFTDDGIDTTLSSRRPFQQGTQVTDHTEDLTEFTEPIVLRTTTTTTTTPAPRTRQTTTTETPVRSTTSSSRGNTSSRTKASSSDSGRGPSRFRPSAAETLEEEEIEAPPQPSGKGRRPTLKPVAELVPAKTESVDIFRHPPRRLEPIFPQPIPDESAAKCNADVCRLPDCYCGGKDIPGRYRANEIPQLVLLTFDDAVNDLNKELYSDLFETDRTNPNGCPIAATFYVSHEWTDYGQVQNLYADGHEIASHTISHSFGEQFSAKKWAKEASGQRDILAAYGGVRMEDIRGLRAPFLSIGGNKMFKMLYDMNFTYDSSMPVYENKPPSWPYTLDYKIFHDCMIPPCPTKSYPGVWEVPMVMWQDLNGGRCSMGDGCSNPPDAEGIYKMLIKNFERHYTTNRAPFPLYYHAAWFTTPHHKEGFEAFLDTIVAMDDVWLVTNWQAIQWVRDPTPLDRIKSFKPFQCDYPERPKRCNAPKVCNAWHKSGVRYMRTCQPCPEVFPWTGRTGVKNIVLDQYLENDAS